jgi:predicted metal-dependent hydrolase
MNEALFDYRVRVSPKAKNLRLRVTVQKGLEVVVPRGYDQTKIPQLLERKKHWIREALRRADDNRKFFEPEPVWRLPIQIKFQAIGAVWHVEQKESEVDWVAVREVGDGRISIFGCIDDERACREALGRWLMRQTRDNLVPRLESLSSRTGLKYRRVFVRRQRTRWASCSRHQSVSLNVKLLFLSPPLVDYVIIHELCHVKELNHSDRFWELVGHHCPDYRALDAQLRSMWKTVPRWAM